MATPPDANPPARAPERVRAEGNGLVGAPSPYLLQHAHNPVDWQPWGEPAFARARAEDKPIFLSVGYSTCHWCHVMEYESFEDDDIARFLNEHFVSIKVDREQRPDVDALYIEAVGAMGESTGWPLTVFLTPDLEPFFGGTYFPPRPAFGRPSFLDVLQGVARAYREQRGELAKYGRAVLDALASAARSDAPGVAPTPALLDDAFASLARARDGALGGFGHGQKFPNAPLLLAELARVQRTGDDAAAAHLSRTLDEMLRGGVRDHLSGTFHRYAVDRRWHVPHFEKTLYDNAQLGHLLVAAGLLMARADWVRAGRDVLDDLLATWRTPEGGFVVGFDADDPGGEGAYYTWTPAELEQALGPELAHTFAVAYDVTARGEAELGGRSVLHRLPPEDLARRLPDRDSAALEAELSDAMARLRAVRSRRPPPAVDEKVLVAWNALAIATLAEAGRRLDEPRYVHAAVACARHLLGMCDGDSGLRRGSFRGADLGPGFLEDQALAGLAFLRLHAATEDPEWLDAAAARHRFIREQHWDPSAHVFRRSARRTGSGALPVDLPDPGDGVLPGGRSAAVRLGLELAHLTGDTARLSEAEAALHAACRDLAARPLSAGALLAAAQDFVTPPPVVAVLGSPNDPAARALWEVAHPISWGPALLLRLDPARPPDLPLAHLQGQGPAPCAQARICALGVCQAPTTDPAALRADLSERALLPPDGDGS